MLCISGFGQFGKIKGISINQIYRVKFTSDKKLLIINDYGKPQMVRSDNFVSYHRIKEISDKFIKSEY